MFSHKISMLGDNFTDNKIIRGIKHKLYDPDYDMEFRTQEVTFVYLITAVRGKNKILIVVLHIKSEQL